MKETAKAVENGEAPTEPPEAVVEQAEELTEDEELAAEAAEAEERAREAAAEKEAEETESSGEDAEEEADAEPTDVVEVAEKQVEEKAEVKTALLDHLTMLRDERTALIDRTRVVLDELDRKGGDTEEQRKYLVAISGISVESDDLESLWATIYGWIKSPQGGIRWGINILQFVGTIVAFVFASRIARKATERGMRMSKGTSNLMRDFVAKLVQRAVIALGVVIGLSTL